MLWVLHGSWKDSGRPGSILLASSVKNLEICACLNQRAQPLTILNHGAISGVAAHVMNCGNDYLTIMVMRMMMMTTVALQVKLTLMVMVIGMALMSMAVLDMLTLRWVAAS